MTPVPGSRPSARRFPAQERQGIETLLERGESRAAAILEER